jgi:hypothetical protein
VVLETKPENDDDETEILLATTQIHNHLSLLDSEMSILTQARISSAISRARLFDGSYDGMRNKRMREKRLESISYVFNL